MPQLSFYVYSPSFGIGHVEILLAWDRYDRGPNAVDDFDIKGMGLYTFMAPVIGEPHLIRIKTKEPISIPSENCPETPDGFPKDFFNRFEIKPGGMALTSIADFTFDVFEDNSLVYSVAPQGSVIKFELSDGSIGTSGISIQDRPFLQPWEDPLEGIIGIVNSELPSKELWRALMTSNQPLEWF